MSRRRRGTRLEMTSLMDVMFLVLVFFIYCIFDMSVHKGIKVDLPSAEGSFERGEKIVITILKDNTFQFNGNFLSRDEILSRVAKLQKVKMDFPIIIAGDRQASLGAGIELLADLKKLGVEHASFQVSGDRDK